MSAPENRRFALMMIGGFSLFLAFAQDIALQQSGSAQLTLDLGVGLLQALF